MLEQQTGTTLGQFRKLQLCPAPNAGRVCERSPLHIEVR